MSLRLLFDEITRRRDKELQRNTGPWPKSQPTASDLSTCPREMALAVLHWQERPPLAHLQARFEVGNDVEQRILQRLSQYGFMVTQQQRALEVKSKGGAVILRGKIDAMLTWEGKSYPFDVKSSDPMIFPKLTHLEALMEHPFYQKYIRQMWAYEYLTGAETGFLLLDNLKGAWRFIEVPLDVDAFQVVLDHCEAAVNSVAEILRQGVGKNPHDFLPPYIDDAATCRRCWALSICQPPDVEAPGVQVLDDAELVAKLDRRAELQPASDEWETLDKEIKSAVKGKDGLLVGDWLVTGKEISRKMPAMPARVDVFWKSKAERITPKGDAPSGHAAQEAD
jgi:hypothetical protein